MRSCSCGEMLRANDRYCRNCGRHAAEPAKRRSRPLAILGALIVLTLAWVLFRGQGASGAGEGTDGGPGAEFEPAADGRLGPLDPDVLPDPDAVDAAAGDLSDRDVAARMEAGPGEPLLGEPTGLGLVVGGIGRGNPLQIIVLDSGEVLELPDVEGWPVGMIGTKLIVQAGSALLAVDLAAPEGGAETILEIEDRELVWTSIDRELIWTMETGSQETFPDRAVGYDVDGEQVDSLELQSGVYSFLWRSAPDLIFNQAGGIYRRSDDGIEFLSNGVLVAVGKRTALVHRCDEEMACRSYWHDRQTWEPLWFAQPPGNPLVSFTVLMGDDRWVATTNIYDGSTTVAAVLTGDVVQRFEVPLDDGPDNGLTASPDGRWLLGPSSGDDKIIDMESGNIWLTGLVFPSEFGRLLVDLTDTALDRQGSGT